MLVSRQCVLECLVLFAVKLEVSEPSVARRESKADVVSRPELIGEPADARQIVRLVTGHDSKRAADVERARLRDRSFEGAVLRFAVAVRDVVRVGRDLPRTFRALTALHVLRAALQEALGFGQTCWHETQIHDLHFAH